MTLARAPRISWCWFCHRAVRHDDDEARMVTVAGNTEWLCGSCVEKADVGPPIPVDYMEDEDAGSQ